MTDCSSREVEIDNNTHTVRNIFFFLVSLYIYGQWCVSGDFASFMLFMFICLWHVQTTRLHRELCHSEARREEAERKAAQAADEVTRLADVANQMEETRKENDRLITQVFNQIFICMFVIYITEML